MKRIILFILGVITLFAMTSCAGGASGGGSGAEESGSLMLSVGTGSGRSAQERAGLFASGSLKVDIAGDDGFTASETTSIVNGQGSVNIKGLKVGSTINVTVTVTTNGNNVYTGSNQTTVQQGTNTVSITVHPVGLNLTIPSDADADYMEALLAKLTDGQTYTLTIGSLGTGVYPSTLLPSLANKLSCNFKIVLDGYTVSGSFLSGVQNLSNVISYDMSNANIGEIYDNAFYCCTNLTEVKLSPDTYRLDGTVFNGCTNLHELELPSSVSMVTNSTFQGSSLTKLTISRDISCGSSSGHLANALNQCTTITTVEIASRGSVPAHILEGSRYVQNVTFSDPETIFSIGTCAFASCDELQEISIPTGVTSIGAGAFQGSTIDTIDLSNFTASVFGGNPAFTNAVITNLTIDADKINNVQSFVEETSGVTNLTLKATTSGICPSFYDIASTYSPKITFDSSIKKILGGSFTGCTNFTFTSSGTWGVDTPPGTGSGIGYTINRDGYLHQSGVQNASNINIKNTSNTYCRN